VSEIPFVNALGDEIERAARRHRGRVRRRIAFGAVAFAIAASGVAAASGVFSSATPEQLATSGISCYSAADLKHSDVTVLSTGTAAPIDACRRYPRLTTSPAARSTGSVGRSPRSRRRRTAGIRTNSPRASRRCSTARPAGARGARAPARRSRRGRAGW
jgi:hypothetical protein